MQHLLILIQLQHPVTGTLLPFGYPEEHLWRNENFGVMRR